MSAQIKTQYQSKEIVNWEWCDVKQWLTDSNSSSVITKLEPQNITGYDLFFLSIEQMKSFNILSFHEINRLSKLIHLKMLEYCNHTFIHYLFIIVRITFTFENKNYCYQLDYEPNLTVEETTKTLAASLGIKDQLFITTNDNRALFPYIKIIDLILLDPDKYRNLKLFNCTQQQTNYPTITFGDGNTNTSTSMPFVPNGVSMKYKKDFEEYCLDKFEQKNPIGHIKTKNKEMKNDQVKADLDNESDMRIGNNTKHTSYLNQNNNNNSNQFQFKIPQKQPSNNTIEERQQETSFSDNKTFVNKTKVNEDVPDDINCNFCSNVNSKYKREDLNNNKNKDSFELNDNTNNSITDNADSKQANINFLYHKKDQIAYEHNKANENKSKCTSLITPSIVDPMQHNRNHIKDEIASYSKKLNNFNKTKQSQNTSYSNKNSNTNYTEITQQSKEKDNYRKMSSDKRNYRTYGNINSMIKNNHQLQQEDFMLNQYKRVNDNGNNAQLEDNFIPYKTEKVDRFSSRHSHSLQVITPKQNDISQPSPYSNHQSIYNQKAKDNHTQRREYNNYHIDKKNQNAVILSNSSENDQEDDSINQMAFI